MLSGSCPKCNSTLLEGGKKTAWCRECFYFFTPEEIQTRLTYTKQTTAVLLYRQRHREKYNEYMRNYMRCRRGIN